MSNEKLPKMPDYLDHDLSHMSHVEMIAAVNEHGRACYLAGLAAAREAVPFEAHNPAPDATDTMAVALGKSIADAFNGCRLFILANITELEKEAGK